jgi:hypothetical protein
MPWMMVVIRSVNPSILTLIIDPRISDVKLTRLFTASSQIFCRPATKVASLDELPVATVMMSVN